jgi:hypothetical protein
MPDTKNRKYQKEFEAWLIGRKGLKTIPIDKRLPDNEETYQAWLRQYHPEEIPVDVVPTEEDAAFNAWLFSEYGNNWQDMEPVVENGKPVLNPDGTPEMQPKYLNQELKDWWNQYVYAPAQQDYTHKTSVAQGKAVADWQTQQEKDAAAAQADAESQLIKGYNAGMPGATDLEIAKARYDAQNLSAYQQQWQAQQDKIASANQGFTAVQAQRANFLGQQSQWNPNTQPMNAAQWNQWKSAIGGSLDPTRDWVQKYQLDNAVNPFEPQTKIDQYQADITQTTNDLKYWQGEADKVRERLKDPHDTLTEARINQIMYGQNPEGGATPEESWAVMALSTPQYLQEKLYTQKQDAFNAGFLVTDTGGKPQLSGKADYVPPATPKQPASTPSTPEWMAPFVSTKIGQPVKQEKVATPSLQSWNRLLPSEQTGVMGFANWAGQKPDDILAQMESMRPLSPTGYRWRPSMQ